MALTNSITMTPLTRKGMKQSVTMLRKVIPVQMAVTLTIRGSFQKVPQQLQDSCFIEDQRPNLSDCRVSHTTSLQQITNRFIVCAGSAERSAKTYVSEVIGPTPSPILLSITSSLNNESRAASSAKFIQDRINSAKLKSRKERMNSIHSLQREISVSGSRCLSLL